jgi:hypothetical protein
MFPVSNRDQLIIDGSRPFLFVEFHFVCGAHKHKKRSAKTELVLVFKCLCCLFCVLRVFINVIMDVIDQTLLLI